MAPATSPTDTETVAVPPQGISAVTGPIQRRPRRRWMKWGLLAVILVGLGAVAEIWQIHSANAVSYETVTVERGRVQASVTATGTLNAVVDVQVGSQVSGNIIALFADFNTKVTKGQLVAQIDPQTFQTQVDQATAALASVHSGVLTAGAQGQKAQSDLAGTMASEKGVESILAKDHANAVNAANQYQRQDAGFTKGLISQQDHDLAKATVDAAEAQVAADESQIAAAKQTILSAQDQLNVARDQVISAQAQERQSQASLEQAKVNLGHTKITAPVDGTVIARRMDVGQTVAASFSAPTIFEIAQDLTKMQLDTNVDESDIGNVSAGQQATFTVDAYPAMTFHGEVTAVRKAPISQQNVVTYDVVIAVANPDLKLFPGMTANARILTAKLDNALKVPNAVLRNHPTPAMLAQLGLPPVQAGKQELYVKRNGTLQAVQASFGLSDGKDTAVIAGSLREGDQVVVRLTAGTPAPAGTAPSAPGTGGGRRGSGI